jgi:arylformamidase
MAGRIVDLSHAIVDAMTTHPGIPGPRITTYLSHAESVGRYAPGTSFQIGRIDLVANTGTYLDTPAHRFPDGSDLGELALDAVADLPGLVVDLDGHDGAIEPDNVDVDSVRGRAVLIRTGWDRHWGTDAYLAGNPFLTAATARTLVDAGALLVGIDSVNVDSLTDSARPAHTAVLAAGLPLVEHLTGLGGLPRDGFRFFAVPPRIVGLATFPVRAFAIVE